MALRTRGIVVWQPERVRGAVAMSEPIGMTVEAKSVVGGRVGIRLAGDCAGRIADDAAMGRIDLSARVTRCAIGIAACLRGNAKRRADRGAVALGARNAEVWAASWIGRSARHERKFVLWMRAAAKPVLPLVGRVTLCAVGSTHRLAA